MDRITSKFESPCRLWSLQFFAVMLLLIPCGISQANDWDLSGELNGSITYTDNVRLATSGGEEDDVVTIFRPTLSLTRLDNRYSVDVTYQLQGLLYLNDSDLNEAYNFLQADVKTVVVPDLFYLDLNSSISQTIIDPSNNLIHSTISASGNVSEVATATVSPYVQKDLGAYTALQAGYRASIVENAEPTLFDSKQGEVFGAITNEGGAGIIDWRLYYTSRIIEYDVGTEIELQRGSAEFGFRLSPRTELVLEGGEDNNKADLPGSRIADGTFWFAGFRGGIGDTILYDVRAGEQFFGDSYSISFSRDTNQLSSNLSYAETATTAGAEQLDYTNAFNYLTDIDGFDQSTVDPELYIRKRFDFSSRYTRGKSSYQVTVFYEDRTFIRSELDGEKENVMGMGLQWMWDYDDVTEVDVGMDFSRLDSRDTFTQPESYLLSIGVQREVFDNSSLELRFYSNVRAATPNNRDYTENTIALSYGREFGRNR